MKKTDLPEKRHSLCEILDRVLDKGAVASGEITLSLAGVDLVYLNLKLLIASSARMMAEQYRNELTTGGNGGR